MTTIIGAGLSGLIAATQLPTARVHEANNSEALSHRAVLRFRSSLLSDLTGIPFRKVTVRKSIFYDGHVLPSIDVANCYSRKTNGMYLNRSIWDISPVERYIAPEDLQQQLIAMIGNRISWNSAFTAADFAMNEGPFISTLPMPVLRKIVDVNVPTGATPEFQHASIEVDRYRVLGADVFQTIYYPHPGQSCYRASITGDLLIVERVSDLKIGELNYICDSFGIRADDVQLLDSAHKQRFGKIAPIDDVWRKRFILQATLSHNIYSLGRFATWRNILLDDVVHDIAVIKRLITSGSYGAVLHNTQRLP